MRQLKITQQITARENDSLERYLQEIAKEGMITPDQEVQLARRIRTGDQRALEQMTKANLRFVISVAKQYQNQGLSLSDLINEGNIGLIKAAQRFDESKGFKFISYAVWWIRQSIMQALVENSRMVRLPLNKIGSYSKITKMMVKFEQNFEREPTRDELADLMNVTRKDIDEMMKGMSRHISIDAPVGDSDSSAMVDLFEDEDDKGVELTMHNDSLRIEVQTVLATMNPRDAAILSCYFGVNGEEQIGLDEIGRKFGLTKERVRQIKEKAIRKLRKSSSTKPLLGYLGQ
jgi:RNA polymerase primary sigma factor